MKRRDNTRQYMSIDMIRTGKLIQAQIRKAGYTQTEIASHMDVSNTAVCSWCQGKQMPTIDHLDELAFLLEIPCASLIVHYGDPKSPDDEDIGKTVPASAPVCIRR